MTVIVLAVGIRRHACFRAEHDSRVHGTWLRRSRARNRFILRAAEWEKQILYLHDMITQEIVFSRNDTFPGVYKVPHREQEHTYAF